MTAERWIRDLLSTRRLERPDGRMLYGYRLSDTEYLSLRDVLHYATGFGSIDTVFARFPGFPALFVLYAAEWWRREYSGGAWRWSPIIQSFQGDPEQLQANNRSSSVIRGFAYWGHQPSGEGKKFFGAIVAHGGLPLKFIGQGAGKLASLMAHTLRLAARYGWGETSIADAVAERAEDLPDSLQRIEIYELIARMVCTVLELKKEFGLAGEADPLAVLERKDPDWRQRFPLSLNDSAAQTLLSGLVTEAAHQIAVSTSSVFAVERSLRNISPGHFELVSSFVSPSKVSGESIASLFGFRSSDSLPRYFSIDAQVIQREPLAEARQILGAETPTVALVARKRSWHSLDACAEHTILIRGPSGDLSDSPLSVPGGGELFVGEPWLFVVRDGDISWIAAGSARVPEEEVFVALPAGWTIEPIGSQSVARSEGVVDLKSQQMALHVVRGDCKLIGHEHSYRVRTSQGTGTRDSYSWEGRRLSYFSSPQAVYVGAPRLFRYSENGERAQVAASILRWFVAGTRIPLDGPNTARGPVDVYLMHEEERITRFRFVLLDSSSRIDFTSGATTSLGAIQFDRWGFSDISVDDNSNLNVEFEKSASGTAVRMQSGDLPPESVAIRLRWMQCPIELRIRLPFPCSGGRFFDSTGKPLREGTGLPLQRLVGARLHIFDRNPQSPKRYDMQMVLARADQDPRSSDLKTEQEIRLTKDGSAEVRLIDLQKSIETLMSFSDDLDAAVDLTVLVGRQRANSVRISRYEVSLEQDSLFVRFPDRALGHFELDALRNVALLAVPLTNLDLTPVQLSPQTTEGVFSAVWSTAPLDAEQGSWLIFPAENSSILFRPTVWLGTEASDDELLTPLQGCELARAMGISNAKTRLVAISQAIQAMTSDFNHPSWPLLEHIWEVFHHLPLSSLDIFRVLCAQPEAAVCLMLRSQLPEDALVEFVRRLRDELGLILELTSIDMWRQAIARLWRYWISLLGHEGAKLSFPIVLKTRLDRLARDFPHLKLMLDFTYYEVASVKSEELSNLWNEAEHDSTAVLRRLWSGVDSLGNSLLFVVHADDAQWPEREFFEPAWQGFVESSHPDAQRQIKSIARLLFWIQRGDFKLSVANTPVLCALWSATSTKSDWWESPMKQLALRKIRAFDPIWFEQAYRQAFAGCLALNDFVLPQQFIDLESAD